MQLYIDNKKVKLKNKKYNSLGGAINEITNELKRHEFEQKAKEMAITDSADRIVACLKDISRKPDERRRKTWTADRLKNRLGKRKP